MPRVKGRQSVNHVAKAQKGLVKSPDGAKIRIKVVLDLAEGVLLLRKGLNSM